MTDKLMYDKLIAMQLLMIVNIILTIGVLIFK